MVTKIYMMVILAELEITFSNKIRLWKYQWKDCKYSVTGRRWFIIWCLLILCRTSFEDSGVAFSGALMLCWQDLLRDTW